MLDVSFIDQNQGWAVGSGSTIGSPGNLMFAGIVLGTMDGGSTWLPQANFSSEQMVRVTAMDKLNAYVLGGSGSVLRTADAGLTWTDQANGVSAEFYTVDFSDDYNGWAGGLEGTIMNTGDGGISWKPQESNALGFSIFGISFVDADNGWAAAVAPYPFIAGAVLHTSDGGATWTRQITSDTPFYDVAAIDGQSAWVAGEGGILLHTINGGSSWDRVDIGITRSINHIQFIDALHGWLVAGEYALHTSDAGITWEKYDMGYSSSTGMDFVNDLVGWVIFDFQAVSTNDGGKTWQQHSMPVTPLKGVDFVDELNGWIVGGVFGGAIFRTDDGGNTWICEASSSDWYPYGINSITAVSFRSATRGLAFGSWGAIVRYGPPAGNLLKTTSVSLSSSANPSILGQSITFTADVTAPSSAASVPTGIVTFKDGAAILGAGILNASGRVIFSSSSLGIGSHDIAAIYSGDTSFASNTSLILIEDILQNGDTITGGKIAFNADYYPEYPNDEIWVMNSDGSGKVRLTHNSEADSLPDWSPDGKKIAFLENTPPQAGSSTWGYDVFSINVDGSDLTRLTHLSTSLYLVKWTPDGKIGFVRADFEASIWVMNSDGSSQIKLASGEWPAWSPDGSKIIYKAWRNGYSYLYVMNGDGTNQTQLSPGYFFGNYLAWSPDGTTIAYVDSLNGGIQIYLMDSDGSHRRVITNSAGMNTYPTWSPDGTHIAFMSSRDGNSEIYVMNADGSNQTNMTNTYFNEAEPAWSSGSVTSPTSITLTPSVNPSVSGQSITFTAKVTAVSGPGTPSGPVIFKDGTTTLGSEVLNVSGQATYSTSTLSPGIHSITATYAGNVNFDAGASATLIQNIWENGDANEDGLVTMGDVTKVERIILQLDPVTCACDANGDGITTMGDVTKIERIILGLDQ